MAYSLGLYDNSPAAVPWLKVKTDAMVTGRQFKLLPELLQTQGYTAHAVVRPYARGKKRSH